MVKRAYAPGPQRKRKGGAPSEYKKSLNEKQTLKKWYGVSERQFKRYVTETLEKMGKVENVAAELIGRLEKRLDNVVYRLGFANTRAGARQLVAHGFFSVNGRKVDIPSYEVEKDDVIALKDNKKQKGNMKELANKLKTKEVPAWLILEKEKLSGKAVGEPNLDEVKAPAEISSIFEFYSR
jgi:small subunit ribosomal protein S4